MSIAAESVLTRRWPASSPPEAGLAVQEAFDAKAKPPGSLGRLEELAGRVAAIQGTTTPDLPTPAVVVCAADHGVAVEGVSVPAGGHRGDGGDLRLRRCGGVGAGRRAGARLVVADLGVKVLVAHPAVLDRRIGPGTANAAEGPAMSVAQAEQALSVGIELAGGWSTTGLT